MAAQMKASIDEGALEVGNVGVELVDFVPQEQAFIRGDLVIAAASGVELFSCIAYPFGKDRFNKAVDILSLRIYGKLAGFKIAVNIGKPFVYLFSILAGNDTLVSEHKGMSHASLDIFSPETAVKGDR